MDQALSPVRDDDDDTLDLLTRTTGAGAAVAHIRKVAELTGSSAIAGADGLAASKSPQ